MVAGSCYLRAFTAEPCRGRLQRAHLVKQQTLRREVWNTRYRRGFELPLLRTFLGWPCWWVWACEHHHYMLDKSRKLRVPRHKLPPALEAAAAEYELGWWLDREYGELRP